MVTVAVVVVVVMVVTDGGVGDCSGGGGGGIPAGRMPAMGYVGTLSAARWATITEKNSRDLWQKFSLATRFFASKFTLE